MCATLGSLASTSRSFFDGCRFVSLACSSFDLLTCFFISTSYIAFGPILPFSSLPLHQRFYAIATSLSSFSPIPNFCSIDKHFHSDRIFDLGIFFYRIDRIGIADWLHQFLNYSSFIFFFLLPWSEVAYLECPASASCSNHPYFSFIFMI